MEFNVLGLNILNFQFEFESIQLEKVEIFFMIWNL